MIWLAIKSTFPRTIREFKLGNIGIFFRRIVPGIVTEVKLLQPLKAS